MHIGFPIAVKTNKFRAKNDPSEIKRQVDVKLFTQIHQKTPEMCEL